MEKKRNITERRKEYTRFYISERRRRLKLEAIEYKGGKCERCGYNKCPAALVFHHTNPNEKEFGIAEEGRIYRNIESIKAELDKCALLCHNCHAEEHAQQNEILRLLKLEKINKERVNSKSIYVRCANCNKKLKYLIVDLLKIISVQKNVETFIFIMMVGYLMKSCCNFILKCQ